MASCPDFGDKDLRIVLIGKTGAGKSVTGNTILGTGVFHSDLSSISVTKECKRGSSVRFGRHLQVVDTPGMYDTEMSMKAIARELSMCVTMNAPGVHAFVLVISVDRFTEEEHNSVKRYRDIFGADMADNLIILFTKRDELDHHKKTIEDFIGGQPKLRSILKDSNERYLTFNNRGTEAEKEKDAQKLVEMIDKLINNGGKIYTNKMYQEAERILKKKEDELKKKHAKPRDIDREQVLQELDERAVLGSNMNERYLLEFEFSGNKSEQPPMIETVALTTVSLRMAVFFFSLSVFIFQLYVI